MTTARGLTVVRCDLCVTSTCNSLEVLTRSVIAKVALLLTRASNRASCTLDLRYAIHCPIPSQGLAQPLCK
jgi:hypothetical protein